MEKDFDDLVEEALRNAQEDRELAKAAYIKMEPVFDIDATDPSTLQSVMLVGAQAVKLLEQMSRTNDQIKSLAQLKQKDKPSSKERNPINIEELKLSIQQHKEDVA